MQWVKYYKSTGMFDTMTLELEAGQALKHADGINCSSCSLFYNIIPNVAPKF